MSVARVLAGLVALAAVLAVGAYWIGPGVVPRAKLELLALDRFSRFSTDATLAAPVDTAPPVRVPLIMAVRNVGERASEVRVLSISLPGWVRLEDENGAIPPVTDDGDEPLRRYSFSLGAEPIEPGSLPQVPAGLDRLSLIAELPVMTCRLRWDGVPEFAPAADYDPAALARVAAFWSIEDGRVRQTGLLTLRLDPALLHRPAPPFSVGDVTIRRPDAAFPPTGELTLEGYRTLTCGAPEQRVDLQSVVWRTGAPPGGRMIVVLHDGEVRRILFDLDGDGRTEREIWDSDRDGRFEATRTASFEIPPFLLTARDSAAGNPLPAVAATAAVDSITAGVEGGDSVRPDSVRPDTVRPDTVRRDTVGWELRGTAEREGAGR